MTVYKFHRVGYYTYRYGYKRYFPILLRLIYKKKCLIYANVSCKIRSNFRNYPVLTMSTGINVQCKIGTCLRKNIQSRQCSMRSITCNIQRTFMNFSLFNSIKYNIIHIHILNNYIESHGVYISI